MCLCVPSFFYVICYTVFSHRVAQFSGFVPRECLLFSFGVQKKIYLLLIVQLRNF